MIFIAIIKFTSIASSLKFDLRNHKKRIDLGIFINEICKIKDKFYN